MESAPDPFKLLKPKRKIKGYSAILLPFLENGNIDWDGFCNHVKRTYDNGLVPAINMDTGYGNFLDDSTKEEVLKQTRAVLGKGPFIAGAFVADQPGASCNLSAYRNAIEQIQRYQGLPVIFQSFGLTSLNNKDLINAYKEIGKFSPQYFAFELSTQFAPFGKIYDLDTYKELLQIPACLGAKHSSLNRMLEWQRLVLRNETRPDFMVFTGNDLAIDMVMYGSDYLLGLSTFAPDAFAVRDKMWETGDPRFHELNDLLQYLGFLTFRGPVPAYKHSAAQFLKLKGWIKTNKTHPKSPERPESDIPLLQDISLRIDAFIREVS
jgi:dihydrodipicolinate synthase/N-acetylneuraminate lyase